MGTLYRETIRKARALGLRVHEGEPHYDVDTSKTWSTSKKSSKKAPIRPHTREVPEEPLNAEGARTVVGAQADRLKQLKEPARTSGSRMA